MKVAVGLGLMEFPFAGAGDYWRWVDLCEAGGVDSLWQTDRLVSRQPILECMTTMAALAGRTRRMRFGMNVVSLALRDPILLGFSTASSEAAYPRTLEALDKFGVPPRIVALQSLSRARQALVLRHWLRLHHATTPSTAQLTELLDQVAVCTTRGHRLHLKVGQGFVQRQGQHLQWQAV